MSRGWPTAARACSVPMSGGRVLEPERRLAERDRAGRHEHDAVPGGARRRELGAELGDRVVVDRAAARRDGRAADLDRRPSRRHLHDATLGAALTVAGTWHARPAARDRRLRNHRTAYANPSTNSSSTSPMRTTSPSRAPARVKRAFDAHAPEAVAARRRALRCSSCRPWRRPARRLGPAPGRRRRRRARPRSPPRRDAGRRSPPRPARRRGLRRPSCPGCPGTGRCPGG